MHNGAIQSAGDSNDPGTAIASSMRSGQLHCLKYAICALVETIRLPACVWQAMGKELFTYR